MRNVQRPATNCCLSGPRLRSATRRARPQRRAPSAILDQAGKLNPRSTRAYHLRRSHALKGLDKRQAAAELERAAATQPASALDFFLTGETHLNEGQWHEAAANFTQATQVDPSHFWARYLLGICNLRLQLPAEAKIHFDVCLTSRQDSLWPYLMRGIANGQLNQFRAAEMDFRQALRLKPTGPESEPIEYGIRVNQAALCLGEVRQADGLMPIFLPYPLLLRTLTSLARRVAQMHRAEEAAGGCAELSWNSALGLEQNEYPVYLYLGLVRQQQHKLVEAIKLLGQAIDLAAQREPGIRAHLLVQRARLYREQGDMNQAAVDFAAALDLFPRAEDYAEHGRILHMLKKHDDALVQYEKALRLRSKDPEVYRWKAETLLAMHPINSDASHLAERDRKAVVALDQYWKQGGRATAEFYRTRHVLLARLKILHAAKLDYSDALKLQPDAATPRARGWCCMAGEEMRDAVSDFDAAIQLNNQYADAYAPAGACSCLARPGPRSTRRCQNGNTP